MADNNGENCLPGNSVFERIPNTPMEREEDDDLELNGGQKTPKGIVTSELGDQQSEKPASMFVFLRNLKFFSINLYK